MPLSTSSPLLLESLLLDFYRHGLGLGDLLRRFADTRSHHGVLPFVRSGAGDGDDNRLDFSRHGLGLGDLLRRRMRSHDGDGEHDRGDRCRILRTACCLRATESQLFERLSLALATPWGL